MNMLKVFGHTPPDTDTICAPIVYAWHLSQKMNTPAKAYRVGELNKETKFVLDYFGVEVPENLTEVTDEDKIVIIDTNNPEELIKGFDNAEIVEIIDHHKLVGGISTAQPIKITIRTYGCSATIVWQIMKGEGHEQIPTSMAGLLLSAILSDTLKFSSPTTTDADIESAKELALIADVNIDEYAKQMFDAKSNLDGYTPEEIVKIDSKVFDMGDNKVRVSVLETTNPDVALSMQSALEEAMKNIMNKDGLDGIYLFVVDIIKNESTLITSEAAEKEIAERAFGAKFEGDSRMKLSGVVSRKKQMVPNLEKTYTSN